MAFHDAQVSARQCISLVRTGQASAPAPDAEIQIRRSPRNSQRGTAGSSALWGGLSGGIIGILISGIAYALWEVRSNGLHIHVVEGAFIAASIPGFIAGAIIGGAWRGARDAH